MPDPKMLSGELSLWSAVLLGQGETDWAELLDQAAAKLARGLRCINLGRLGQGGYLRNCPIVSVQATPFSRRNYPVMRALVLQVRH
jgi:hypothetical protein